MSYDDFTFLFRVNGHLIPIAAGVRQLLLRGIDRAHAGKGMGNSKPIITPLNYDSNY